jgi:hypothetical protein
MVRQGEAMSWWSKLRGRSRGRPQAVPEAEPTWPVAVEIVPGALSARVHLHRIDLARGPIECWSYVTEGFAGLNRPELVFTLRRDPDEVRGRFPPDPLHLFAMVYSLARSGQPTESGTISELGDRGLFGHHILYVTAEPLPEVPLPSWCLAVLLVTTDEVRAAREHGTTRLLALLCHQANYYPFPPWADRRRPGLSLERTFDESLLSKIPRVRADDTSVAMAGKQVTADLVRSEKSPWEERLAQVPDASPFALLTARDPSASGCLVWQPGQQQPEAMARPGGDGSPLCGSFIALVPDQTTTGGKILEDGFVVELTGEAWSALRRALIDGDDISIPATGDDMSLTLKWRDDLYVSPVDGQAYRAGGGWQTYTPEQPPEQVPEQASGRVTMREVRLLTPQSAIAARTSVSDLAAFCHQLHLSAAHVLGDHDGAVEILVQLRCTPQGHDVNLAARGEPPQAALQALLEAIHRLDRLPVRSEDVSFEVHLSVSAPAAARS